MPSTSGGTPQTPSQSTAAGGVNTPVAPATTNTGRAPADPIGGTQTQPPTGSTSSRGRASPGPAPTLGISAADLVLATTAATARCRSVFPDPCGAGSSGFAGRSAVHIHWHPERARFAVAYAAAASASSLVPAHEHLHGRAGASGGLSRLDGTAQAPRRRCAATAFIWDASRPTVPVAELSPPAPMRSIRFHPKTPDLLIGGCANGLIALFDARKAVAQQPGQLQQQLAPVLSAAAPTSTSALANTSASATTAMPGSSQGPAGATSTSSLSAPFISSGCLVGCTAAELSHSDPVVDVQWVQSKTNSQIVSVSTGKLVHGVSLVAAYMMNRYAAHP